MDNSVTQIENETIIRFDESNAPALLYTASRRTAAGWERLGYVLTVAGRDAAGRPHSWRGEAPKAAVRLRRRSTIGHRRPGTGFGSRKTTVPEYRSDRQPCQVSIEAVPSSEAAIL